jgi:hypothetical protein
MLMKLSANPLEPLPKDVAMSSTGFPIDLSTLEPVKLDPAVRFLTDQQKATLKHNIQRCRDTIVFFTALAGAKGLSGHTGGAYDTVPELTIIRAFIANGVPIVPVFYDEAGHRVATIMLGSDGSQMEGDNAEAARLTVGKQLNVKVLVDDNNVTIAGHPQEYMVGYDLTRTLAGYGLQTETTMGEDLDALYVDLCRMFADQRPHALIVKRGHGPGHRGRRGKSKGP